MAGVEDASYVTLELITPIESSSTNISVSHELLVSLSESFSSHPLKSISAI